MEKICGVTVDGQLRELRRLLYCGEWIESHALHIYMLHAPDFLGYPDAIKLARDYPDVVQRGLRLKKTGNEIMTLLGGREIHPINVKVGGFYRVPPRAELQTLREKLEWARDASLETVQFAQNLSFPDYERDYEFVALRHPGEYPLNEGRVVSSKGIDIPVEQYEEVFEEQQVERSTALHSVTKRRGPYFVGPLARYSLNFDKLSTLARASAVAAGLGPVCRNPFQSIIVRSVEMLYACDEALRIIDQYKPPDEPSVLVPPRAGIGQACTEAPRGILYHRYAIDEKGTILDAKIVPPTSQNQKTIEADLTEVVAENVQLSHDELTLLCEQSVRNYDPCISCSTHFLRLEVERQ